MWNETFFWIYSHKLTFQEVRTIWYVVRISSFDESVCDTGQIESFYEELEHVFDHFPKYHVKILLGEFNLKFGRENIFKPTIWEESLHQDSNANA